MPVEYLSRQMERIAPRGRDLEELGRGYEVADAPTWHAEGGYLIFSDIFGDKRMRWSPEDGVSLLLEPTGKASGLTRDPQGRLIACEYGNRRVTRLEAGGRSMVVADRYQGERLNHPNDVVVRADGSIYFTDPGTPDPALDLDFAGVYKVSPDLGRLTLLAADFLLPNGLAFSPDESILYVDDSRRSHIRAFDVRPDGTLTNDRVLCELEGEWLEHPDGMRVDTEGNLYCARGSIGVSVIDPAGALLGTISVGAERATNCGWGGDDWKTLYITTRESLSRIRLNVAGIPLPPL